MTSIANKFGFYSSLYLDYTGLRAGHFTEPSDAPIGQREVLKRNLRVHFWTPVRTQGAVVTVYDVLPSILTLQNQLNLNWTVTAGQELPADRCDWLICFKAVPDSATWQRHAKVAMLICDQAEVFWTKLPQFDLQVATSSRTFASVASRANKETFFIGETEPQNYIESGRSALRVPPSKREPILIWHGGPQSLDGLHLLRPGLETIARRRPLELYIVSGQNADRTERWDKLSVRYFAWSVETLKATASKSMLGIIPARKGARVSYLKPASRIRCLYALGVPAIGDRRVSDAEYFATKFGGPLAHGVEEWTSRIEQLLDEPCKLDSLALSGHAEVASNFSTKNTALRWLRLLGCLV